MRTNDNGVDREMTANELAEYEQTAAAVAAEETAAAAAQAERDAARQSALAKLSALGLTDTEIAALVGG
jgi:alkylhydroperoxidase family enzyme